MHTKLSLKQSLSLTLLPLALATLGPTQAQPATPQAVTKPTLTVVYSFTAVEGGANPLTVGADGALYGTAEYGHAPDYRGNIFKVTQGGVFHELATLHDQIGIYPVGTLLLMPDGALMGAASVGGKANTGALFLLTPPHRFQTKHEFSAVTGPPTANNTRGAYPEGSLALAADGAVYGTTESGGTGGQGIVYRWTEARGVEVVHDFLDGAQGSMPERGLTMGPDGVLYGTTNSGGSSLNNGYGDGTVYRITTDGVFTLLHPFREKDGQFPLYPPVFGQDGALYGTTETGGAYGNGVFYRITTDGTFRLLHSFTKNEVGRYEASGLTLGPDGSFYGTDSALGAYGNGKVFRLSPAGDMTTVYSFQPGIAGDAPADGVTFEPDGAMYGLTAQGGQYGCGTVFKLRLPPPGGANVPFDR